MLCRNNKMSYLCSEIRTKSKPDSAQELAQCNKKQGINRQKDAKDKIYQDARLRE